MVRNSSSITISPSREFEIAGSRHNLENQPSISNLIEKSFRTVLLLDNQLTVHWEAVPGVTSYLVQIKLVGEKNAPVIREQVSETKAVYSGDPLKPGVEYELVVKPHDNQFSESDAATRLNFRLLDKDVAQRVQEAEETLAKLDLPEASTALNQLYESLFVAARLSPADRAFCNMLYQINRAWCCNHPRCLAYDPCRVGNP